MEQVFGKEDSIKDISENYDIVGGLGRGSIGKLFTAVDKSNGQIFALKVMKNWPDEARREVAALKEVSRVGCYKYIVCYYKSFQAYLHGFLVDVIQMEHVDGITLAQWKKQWYQKEKTGPSVEFLHKLAKELFTALAYIHKNDLYHQDLHPGNVMIEKNPPNNIKLIDFGIACSYKWGKDHNCKRSHWGTQKYMSPDYLVHCIKNYTNVCNNKTRSGNDVWAAVLMIWELLRLDNTVENFSNNTLKTMVIDDHIIEQCIQNGLKLDIAERWTAEEMLLLFK